MKRWISLLAVFVLLMGLCGCNTAPAESLSPLEELYREREQLAQPVLEEYERRLEEAVEAAEDGDLLSVRVNNEVTVTDKALIHRLLAVLQKLELQMNRDADETMFEENEIIFGARAFSMVFVYADEEVSLGNWEDERMYLRYPAYPDAPTDYVVTNISAEISQEKAALEEAIDLPLPDWNIG